MDKNIVDIISAGIRLNDRYIAEAIAVEETNAKRAARLWAKVHAINEYMEVIRDIFDIDADSKAAL